MKLLVLLTLSVVLGLGCASGNKKKYPWRHYETTTPQGYRVAWVDEGDHGPENEDVYRWHAMAVESGAHRLFSTYEGPTYEQLIEVAKRVRWVLHDNCCFVASDGWTWAAGERIPSSGWG